MPFLCAKKAKKAAVRTCWVWQGRGDIATIKNEAEGHTARVLQGNAVCRRKKAKDSYEFINCLQFVYNYIILVAYTMSVLS